MGQVDRMLREMAGAQSVQVVSRTGSVTRLARLVLRRNTRFENVLSQSGLTPAQDENGRTRYLPPGSQLPGHHNPFAQQGLGFPQQAPAHQAAAAPGHRQLQPAAPQWQVPPQPAQQPQHPQQPVPQGQFGLGGPYGQQGRQVPPGQAQPQYYGHPAPPQPGPGQPAPQPPYGQQQPPAPYPYQNGQHSWSGCLSGAGLPYRRAP